jgi:hypothetical protein
MNSKGVVQKLRFIGKLKIVKSRKLHRCWLCQTKIQSKSYVLQTGLYGVRICIYCSLDFLENRYPGIAKNFLPYYLPRYINQLNEKIEATKKQIKDNWAEYVSTNIVKELKDEPR